MGQSLCSSGEVGDGHYDGTVVSDDGYQRCQANGNGTMNVRNDYFVGLIALVSTHVCVFPQKIPSFYHPKLLPWMICTVPHGIVTSNYARNRISIC